MQPARPPLRAPGSFSALPSGSTADPPGRPPPSVRTKRLESISTNSSSASDERNPPTLNIAKARSQQHQAAAAAAASSATSPHSPTPIYASFTSHNNGSTASLQTNFSRPTVSTAVSAAQRSVASLHSPSGDRDRGGGTSPLTLPSISPSSSTFSSRGGAHSRKHSQNAGMFEPTLPSASSSNLAHVGMAAQPSPKLVPAPHREMSASQIAAQAAVLHHQSQQLAQQQQQQQMLQQQQHNRQRSQTAPMPGEYDVLGMRRGTGEPLSPPILSLTEASAPRESGFGNQGYHNGLMGSHSMAATAAANVVFPRSGQSSPGLSTQAPAPPPPPPPPPEKKEKAKVKLFSRPGKINIKGDTKDKPLPSPGKIGQALSSLQRGNFSTTSLESTAQSFYSMTNSSSATIRPIETGTGETKEKEKRHHFLSRQKHKLRDKDEYHLPLSSAMSNSKPTDPSAPSSLYSFNIPSSPGPNSTSFKGMSGLDLRHAGRRDKKKEVFDDAASSYTVEWPGPSSVNSAPGNVGASPYLNEPFDSSKYGLNNMTSDDAWPWLKAKLLLIFEGEDLKLPVEDFNRVVGLHIQYCIARRSPYIIVEDFRDLCATGFSSLDHSLRKTADDRLIPSVVEMWVFTFTTILPCLQAVFLPLDLEFSGNGPLLSPEQARDFWGGVITASSPVETSSTVGQNHSHGVNLAPASTVLEVRRLVLLSFRDIVILPRYETLKTMFSRLSLEFLPQSLASMALASPLPMPSPGYHQAQGGQQMMMAGSPADSQASFGLASSLGGGGGVPRPGTAMSLDPSVASYNSTGTTLLGDGGSGGGSGNRSRAISNVSFGSDHTGVTRPFTPSSLHALGSSNANGSGSLNGGGGPSGSAAGGISSLREQNVEDSKQVTDMVGRMLQCMSVLASVGYVPGSNASAAGGSDAGNKMIEELNKLLKLNWLGRGRTGRNRRGMVGGRVKRDAAAAVAAMLNQESGLGQVAE